MLMMQLALQISARERTSRAVFLLKAHCLMEMRLQSNSKLSLITEVQMWPLKLDFGTVGMGTALYMGWLTKMKCGVTV